MQHVERVPLPHREVHNPVPAILIVALVIVIAVVAGIHYANRGAPATGVAATWENEQFLATNPEMKVALRYAEIRAAIADENFLARNPEISTARHYAQSRAPVYDDAFLAANPELKVQRRYAELLSK